jgi:hypothetical protein
MPKEFEYWHRDVQDNFPASLPFVEIADSFSDMNEHERSNLMICLASQDYSGIGQIIVDSITRQHEQTIAQLATGLHQEHLAMLKEDAEDAIADARREALCAR